MSTKAILVAIVVIVLIAAGGYFVYRNYSGTQLFGMNQTATTTPDQVQAQEVSVGTGTEAKPGSIVSVLYVGRLTNGTVFDSSETQGNKPLTFQLGAPGIITGFQVGVNGMREGGERIMAIPSSLGYGAQEIKNPAGKTVIPANSTLVFNVKLVKVKAAPATSTPAKQ